MKLRPLLLAITLLWLVACSSTAQELATSPVSPATTIGSAPTSGGTDETTTTTVLDNQAEVTTTPSTTLEPQASIPFLPTTISTDSSAPVIVPKPGPSVAQICSNTTAASGARIVSPQLTEISGAVWTGNGIWVHNDAGNPQEIYRIGAPGEGQAGKILETIDLSGQLDSPILDAEDITVIEGHLLLGDTGNNFADGGRESIQLVRIDPQTQSVVATYNYTFPGGAGDVEAIFYDPTDQRVYLIEKARNPGITTDITGPARIFTAPLTESNQPIELSVAGQLDLGPETLQSEAELHPNRQGQLRGIVTGADISPDGSTIAIRTYDTVWIYLRGQDQSVVEALQTVPCEAAITPEPQGESVTFDRSANRLRLATISEASNQPINVITG